MLAKIRSLTYDRVWFIYTEKTFGVETIFTQNLLVNFTNNYKDFGKQSVILSVQLSYQIWPQKTMEGSPDCWANHWYNPPYSPWTVLIQSEQKGWQNHSGPLTSSTLPLWTVTVWSTLQSSEHQNDQTLKQFLLSSNPSHEHLTLNVEHTTLLYIIYSSHIHI